ncbi:hypothetical protein STCU_10548 [Strigomonas culicis]|uniref:Uncharacterized protein n=1 Tax=Strigomonas culicis TaxID=28005 RepID=S9USL8_9TRYP|nr:hypothetical protein STCU_10548 [Strigomonas culicis]|eukprot:EPY17546.1 hypothetical protein STCU_10548 [Strigomonas culicis]
MCMGTREVLGSTTGAPRWVTITQQPSPSSPTLRPGFMKATCCSYKTGLSLSCAGFSRLAMYGCVCGQNFRCRCAHTLGLLLGVHAASGSGVKSIPTKVPDCSDVLAQVARSSPTEPTDSRGATLSLAADVACTSGVASSTSGSSAAATAPAATVASVIASAAAVPASLGIRAAFTFCFGVAAGAAALPSRLPRSMDWRFAATPAPVALSVCAAFSLCFGAAAVTAALARRFSRSIEIRLAAAATAVSATVGACAGFGCSCGGVASAAAAVLDSFCFSSSTRGGVDCAGLIAAARAVTVFTLGCARSVTVTRCCGHAALSHHYDVRFFSSKW